MSGTWNSELDVFAPNGRLPPRVAANGKHLKEVNFPHNATVTRSGRGTTYIIIVSTTGALRLPGYSCTDPNCRCDNRPWPTVGIEVNLLPCNVMCEICGLLRNDFRASASNLRRHVREKHVCEEGKHPDSLSGRLYEGVKEIRKQKPRKKKADLGARIEQGDVNVDEVEDENKDEDGETLIAPISGLSSISHTQQFGGALYPQYPSNTSFSAHTIPYNGGFFQTISNTFYGGYRGGNSSSGAFAVDDYANIPAVSLGGSNEDYGTTPAISAHAGLIGGYTHVGGMCLHGFARRHENSCGHSGIFSSAGQSRGPALCSRSNVLYNLDNGDNEKEKEEKKLVVRLG